jgi:two-component system chemotaxis sensor kinase CheA
MTVDMSKYLSLYVSEATEHLEAFAHEVVKLEKQPDQTSVDSMFRHAHSVKGMAASMGYDRTAAIAHRLEDLVDAVRSDRSLSTRATIDLMLSAADALLGQVRAAGEGAQIEDPAALEAKLTAHLANSKSAPSGSPPTSAVPAAGSNSPGTASSAGAPASWSDSSAPRFTMKLRISQGCQAPGPRAFLALKRLAKLGSLFDLNPSMEELKGGKIPEGQISLELETSSSEAAVRASLQSVSEIEIASMMALETTRNAKKRPIGDAQPPPGPSEAPKTIRIRTELLDYFLDTVGELILATAQIREIGKGVPLAARPLLEEGVDRLHGLVKDLHEKVMSARMTPLSTLTDRLPRPTRDIAHRRGKEVDLVVTGAEVELDRTIVESLSEPVLHILRNCIDHGIESHDDRALAKKAANGRVQISVRRERDRVVLEIEDDGRGMDAEKLRTAAVARGFLTQEAASHLSDREAFMLACLPGVSTAQDVSDISGRGVGMDAVKRAVEEVGGALEIDSERGRGTRFSLRLPLSVSVLNLMLVGIGEEIVGVPVAKVLSALEADSSALSKQGEGALLRHSRAVLPVRHLSQLLGIEGAEHAGVRPYLVMETDSGKVALAVDRLLGQQEVVLKTLSRPLDLIPGLAGVTILGTGRPVFILDVPRLLVT